MYQKLFPFVIFFLTSVAYLIQPTGVFAAGSTSSITITASQTACVMNIYPDEPAPGCLQTYRNADNSRIEYGLISFNLPTNIDPETILVSANVEVQFVDGRTEPYPRDKVLTETYQLLGDFDSNTVTWPTMPNLGPMINRSPTIILDSLNNTSMRYSIYYYAQEKIAAGERKINFAFTVLHDARYTQFVNYNGSVTDPNFAPKLTIEYYDLPSPTVTPTLTATPNPTITPTPTATPTPTNTPVPTPTTNPTPTITPNPTSPASGPTATPTPVAPTLIPPTQTPPAGGPTVTPAQDLFTRILGSFLNPTATPTPASASATQTPTPALTITTTPNPTVSPELSATPTPADTTQTVNTGQLIAILIGSIGIVIIAYTIYKNRIP